MSRTWLRFCRITALLLVLALGSAVCTQSADAGVLERVKAAMDYRHNLVEGALGFVKEGVLEETDPADFNRRTSAFYGRQEVEGINTFAEIVADGRAKLSTGWEGLKGRLADTLLGKAASAVKDKLWDAVSSGQRRTETGRTERSTSRARPAREARKPWEDDTSGDGDAESARTLAEIAADGEVPDFIEPDTSEEADTDSAGGIDPLIALDIDEDEQDWYRSETGILDEGPLPEVRFAAVADGAGRRGPDETSVYPPGDSEGDCEDVWDDCPGDTDWTEQRHEDVGQSDEWVGYDEPQDPGDGYRGGDDWQYEAGNWLDQSGDGQASGLEDDTWRPWADRTVAHGEEGAESDGHSRWGRASNDCDDVWADCPVDTDWGEEQQDATGRFDQWAGYDQPRDDAAAQWQGDDWRYGSEGALDLAPGDEGGAHSAREDYEKALGGVLNEDGSSFADPSPVSERDYQSALQEMEWQVAEQARIEAEKAEARAAEERRRREEARREQEAREKARIEAEKAKAREAEERRRREAERRKKEEEERRSRAGTGSSYGGAEPAGDGCGSRSPPACDKYVRHGEQMQARISHITPASMTDGALLVALNVRAVMGCLRKCMPHEASSSCRNIYQANITELETTYRSAIESASASSAGSSYVHEFDRNPSSSEFVRKLGIRISGSSLDSCGD